MLRCALPGIPCLYYGTEQGLHGHGSDPAVREALWGGPGFNEANFFHREIQHISRVRSRRPPLRYGRFYFRPTSSDGHIFRISTSNGGVVAFSRILGDEEIAELMSLGQCSHTEAADLAGCFRPCLVGASRVRFLESSFQARFFRGWRSILLG